MEESVAFWRPKKLFAFAVASATDHLDNLGVLLAQGLAAAQGGEGVVEERGAGSQPFLPLSPDGWTT